MTREEEIIAEYEAAENRKLSNSEKEFILNVLQWADEHPISGEQIAAMKNEIKFLKRKLAECDKMYRELQNKNPWKEGLPTEDGEYLVECGYYKCGELHAWHKTLYWKHDEWINECLGDFVLRWMPIPSVND